MPIRSQWNNIADETETIATWPVEPSELRAVGFSESAYLWLEDPSRELELRTNCKSTSSQLYSLVSAACGKRSVLCVKSEPEHLDRDEPITWYVVFRQGTLDNFALRWTGDDISIGLDIPIPDWKAIKDATQISPTEYFRRFADSWPCLRIASPHEYSSFVFGDPSVWTEARTLLPRESYRLSEIPEWARQAIPTLLLLSISPHGVASLMDDKEEIWTYDTGKYETTPTYTVFRDWITTAIDDALKLANT